MAMGALRGALAESVLRQLRTLGYGLATPFPADLGMADVDAEVRVPGGGRVAIRMDARARLKFRFAHERAAGVEGALSPDELAFARQQEARWCKDLKSVVAGLVAEGFDSRATLDRAWTSIPVVVHVPVQGDTADEEAKATSVNDANHGRAAEEELQRRRIRAAQQDKKRRLP